MAVVAASKPGTTVPSTPVILSWVATLLKWTKTLTDQKLDSAALGPTVSWVSTQAAWNSLCMVTWFFLPIACRCKDYGEGSFGMTNIYIQMP